MTVTGQERGAPGPRRREDDRVGRGKPVLAAGLGGAERDRGVELHDLADLGEGDDLVGLVLADLAGEPFGEFELHHGRHQPVGLFGQPVSDLLAGRGTDEPFDPGRGVDEDHQTRSERSR